jgi:hypothetical protein
MPSKIGKKTGQAAPAEYSPDSLLTTRGDTIRRDSTGHAARYALPPAGQFLGSDGTDTLGRTPPGYPFVDLGRAYTPSSTNEGSLLNAGAATTGLFAAGVAVGDMWEIFLGGTLLNNSGTSTFTSRLRVYFGAFAIGDVTTPGLTSNAGTRPWMWRLRVYLETLGAAGTGTLRVAAQRAGLDGLLATNTAYISYVGTGGYTEQQATTTGTSASPALITNAASDFNVTATHSNATASMTTTLTEGLVRYYPKNR